jgi:hypothetical protein
MDFHCSWEAARMFALGGFEISILACPECSARSTLREVGASVKVARLR